MHCITGYVFIKFLTQQQSLFSPCITQNRNITERKTKTEYYLDKALSELTP